MRKLHLVTFISFANLFFLNLSLAEAKSAIKCESTTCVKSFTNCTDLKIWTNSSAGTILTSAELKLRKETSCILMNEGGTQLDQQSIAGDDFKTVYSQGHYEFNNAFQRDGVPGHSYLDTLDLAIKDCENQKQVQMQLLGLCQ